MRWLKEHGVINSYDDYMALPLTVIDDARMLMEAEQRERERQQKKREQERQKGGSRGKRR